MLVAEEFCTIVFRTSKGMATTRDTVPAIAPASRVFRASFTATAVSSAAERMFWIVPLTADGKAENIAPSTVGKEEIAPPTVDGIAEIVPPTADGTAEIVSPTTDGIVEIVPPTADGMATRVPATAFDTAPAELAIADPKPCSGPPTSSVTASMLLLFASTDFFFGAKVLFFDTAAFVFISLGALVPPDCMPCIAPPSVFPTDPAAPETADPKFCTTPPTVPAVSATADPKFRITPPTAFIEAPAVSATADWNFCTTPPALSISMLKSGQQMSLYLFTRNKLVVA
mmetsp:Transcript_890/g.1345  ORF Transcript_890/g.1345 Transcript_890/m.1345 type:complete len:285 (-) Transcript_890:114-968(-)